MLGLVALLVALAALVVSCASLYLTSLRAAEIVLDHIPRERELPAGTFSGAIPRSNTVELMFFISNAGARGGLLEAASITGVKIRSTRSEAFWTGLVPQARPIGPLTMEAGDVQVHALVAYLQFAPGTLEKQAHALGGLSSPLTVEVTWSYFRAAGLPSFRFATRPRQRMRVERRLTVDVDTRLYRRETIAFWRAHGDAAHLADIAEGTADAQSA